MRRPLHILLAVLLLALATALAAGCGDDEEPSGEPPTQEATEPESEPEPQEPAETDLARAGVDPITGAYQGLELDTRQGTTPPDVNGSLNNSAAAAGCKLQLDLRDEGNDHLNPGDPPPSYGTNPATSGPHNPVPLADGSYLEMPPETGVVHSLEHGRIAIQYDPALPENQQLLLKGIFSADPDGVVLFPNPKMPYAVAVTAWRNSMGCKKFADPESVTAAILAFRSEFRGKGPERIPL